MITVYASKQTTCPVNLNLIKNILKEELCEYIKDKSCKAEITVVDEKTAANIARLYLGENEKAHNILTFTDSEKKGKFISRDNNQLFLGEIVLCWDLIKKEAENEGIKASEKLVSLVKHGALHLVGIHHK